MNHKWKNHHKKIATHQMRLFNKEAINKQKYLSQNHLHKIDFTPPALVNKCKINDQNLQKIMNPQNVDQIPSFQAFRSKTQGHMLEIQLKNIKDGQQSVPKILTSKSHKNRASYFLKRYSIPNNINHNQQNQAKSHQKYNSFSYKTIKQKNIKYLFQNSYHNNKLLKFKTTSKYYSLNNFRNSVSPQRASGIQEDKVTKKILRQEQRRQKKQFWSSSNFNSLRKNNKLKNFINGVKNSRQVKYSQKVESYPHKKTYSLDKISDIQCCPWSDRNDDQQQMRVSYTSSQNDSPMKFRNI